MASIGTATIKIDPDLHRLTTVMRVLAKHLAACADELEATNTAPAHGTVRVFQSKKADDA